MAEDIEQIAPVRTPIFHRERIEYWSLVAEIVAAVAVVISLVFVGIQLRNANAIAIRDEANATMAQWSEIRRSIYQDGGAGDIFVVGMADPSALDSAQQLRFRMMLREYAWATWHIWDRINNRLIPRGTHWEMGAGRDLLQVLCTPGGKLYWRDIRQEMPPGFPEAVGELVPGYRGPRSERCDLSAETLTPPRTTRPAAR